MASNLKKEQIALRIKCFDEKLSYEESSIICGCTKMAYSQWARYYIKSRNDGILSYEPDKKKRVVMTNEDIKYYKHNEPEKFTSHKTELKERVDHAEAEQICASLGITHKVNNGNKIKVPNLGGKILGNTAGRSSHRATTTETYAIPRCNHGRGCSNGTSKA